VGTRKGGKQVPALGLQGEGGGVGGGEGGGRGGGGGIHGYGGSRNSEKGETRIASPSLTGRKEEKKIM